MPPKYRLHVADEAVISIVRQYDYYLQAGGTSLAMRWEKAVTARLESLRVLPGRGVLSQFSAPELAGIRQLSLTRFPFLIYFRLVASQKLVEVIDVIHNARDTEAALLSRLQ